MIAVSDTSPILYLLLINQLDLLPRLYETIAIPDVVQSEMQARGAPEILKTWISAPPDWLNIFPVPEGDKTTTLNILLQNTNFRVSPQLVRDLLGRFS